MSTTTALDFQAIITQNDGNKKLLESKSIILEKEVIARKKTNCFVDFCSVFRGKPATNSQKILKNAPGAF